VASVLHPRVQERIYVYYANDLDDVKEKLRGRMYQHVFVDHHILERAEQVLESRVRIMRCEYENTIKELEVIR
jgi:hypothetical protein